MPSVAASSSLQATRLAPSPTGALHLGNARTFVVNWVLARQRGWRVAMRMEDLDTPRTKAGADQQALDDLRWLGLDWDGPMLRQSSDLAPYRQALATLHAAGLVYPCTCTRREIEAAQSAPHENDHELRYPGTCRPVIQPFHVTLAPAQSPDTAPTAGRVSIGQAVVEPASAPQATSSADLPPAWRVHAPREPIRFVDHFAGEQLHDIDQQTGDFVIATKARLPAYQLAVVVDDVRQGVTQIVRGDDLLRSAARQRWLYHLLGAPEQAWPSYWHLPLVVGEDGRRLAKRHGDTRLAWYREQGVAPQRVLGLLASWSGSAGGRQPMTINEWLTDFDIARLPQAQAVFTQEDHAWLLAK